MLKKKKGDASVVGGMLATLLTLFVVVTAVFAYALWQTQLGRVYEINLVVHKYLTEMETTDFSNQLEIDLLYENLQAELESHQVTNLSFNGSTRTPVETGEKITLHVTGSLEISQVDMPIGSGLAGAVLGKETHSLDLTKSGTAMY